MVAKSITVRGAAVGDSADILRVLDLMDAEDGGSRSSLIGEEHLRSFVFCPTPRAEALVAERDGKIVGLAAIHESAGTLWCNPEIYVDDLFVVAESRRLGVGRRLVEAVSALAVERSTTRLLLNVQSTNTAAIQFYEALGGTIFPDSRLCAFSGAVLYELASEFAVNLERS